MEGCFCSLFLDFIEQVSLGTADKALHLLSSATGPKVFTVRSEKVFLRLRCFPIDGLPAVAADIGTNGRKYGNTLIHSGVSPQKIALKILVVRCLEMLVNAGLVYV